MKKSVTVTSPTPSRAKVLDLSIREQKADLQLFGKEVRKSQQSAMDFLQRAGIIDTVSINTAILPK